MAYSLDLKQRVLAFIQKNGTITQAARIFSIARPTIYIWLAQPADYDKTRKKPGPTTSSTIDRAKLRQIITDQPDLMLKELAVLFNSNTSTMSYNLAKMKIHRKKNSAIRSSP